MPETPNLTELARGLELRWRMLVFIDYLAYALIVSVGVSVGFAIVHVATRLALPLGRILLMANGAAVVVSLVLTALKRRSPQLLLADADRVYETRELLSSAMEFADDDLPPGRLGAFQVPEDRRVEEASARRGETERAFRRIVAKRGDELSTSVDPGTVYPLAVPRRISISGALAVALGVLLLLNASGWFSRPSVELSQEGLLLEDAGRRLAERSGNEELQELADEIRRLGERLRSGDMDPDEARRRIDQLSERVEEQVRNLERLGEFETNQEIDLPPETEDTVRSALRSGMTEGEVMDFFARMRKDGRTLPDTLRALEEASSDMTPDTNLGLDDDRLRELLDQLNVKPEGVPDGELTEQLENARKSLQQAGAGLEFTEGLESEFGELGDAGNPRPGGRTGMPGEDESGEGMNQADNQTEGGQLAGDKPVADAMDDTFTRIEEANPIFRQLEGIIGEGTIRDVIVRELPSEAVSRMTDTQRETAFQRVIEEAIGRQNTPPELQHLVRNYFLRITLGSDQGVQDEQ